MATDENARIQELESALAAAKNAAPDVSPADQDKPRFVVFQGERYRLPADPQDWTVDTLEAFETGKVVTAVKGVLGNAAWQKISASGIKVRDLEPLMEQIVKAYGFGSTGE